jgi:hypothetical protein
VVYEKLPVAESPEHADAGQLSVPCRLDVYIAVAYVDGIVGGGT